MRGRKPKPTAIRRLDGNPGKRAFNATDPMPPDSMPTCPPHLSDEAADEWDRLGPVLHAMGVVTMADRVALAAYCQAYGRWVEAEERLREAPLLLKTPSGYVRMPDAEFEAILTRAAEVGAKRTPADAGIDGKDAALDIRDLRSVLDGIRLVRRTAMQTAVRMITTGVMLALLAGIAIKLKIFGGDP